MVPFLDMRVIRVTSSRAARVTAKGPAKDAGLFLVTTAYCPLTPFPLHRLGLQSQKEHIVLNSAVVDAEILGLEKEKRQVVLKSDEDLKDI